MTLNLMKDIYLNSLINRYRFGASVKPECTIRTFV